MSLLAARTREGLRRCLPVPVLTLTVSAAIILAACQGETRGPPTEGSPAPEYSATTLDGREVSLESLKGEPVLLNFWATWCTPCRKETPFLQSLHEEFADRGLQVVGVSMDSRGSAEEIRAFMDRYDVTYRILHDPASRAMDVFSVIGLPATYLLEADGTVRFVRIGPVAEDDREFMSALNQALES